MRGKRTDLPTTFEGMQQHLLDALKRVEEGRPQHPKLIEQAKKGRLKVTISSVALEAGVSRTLIGFDGCRYTEVRKKILGVNEAIPVRAPTDMRTINANLREVNKVLEQRFKMALSENAAMLIRMGKLEREYADKAEEIQRINNRGKRNQNEIVGLHIVKPGEQNR
ncbi:hypothetical protein [Massilia phyllosphaerae]|uniref:hypothetical protein n=1 Tax=Massilia phyllosphaerae TaxID=3106034 RepID=UPI002B1CC651|nr:hypothetical protein [Massilia sp. SGZ-792]